MGSCFSKKQGLQPPPPPLQPSPPIPSLSDGQDDRRKKTMKKKEHLAPPPPPPPPLPNPTPILEKKPVFLIANTSNNKSPVLEERKVDKESKKGEILVVEEQRPVAVRTSSCTKEEVDAILIQCGRLSRSSSGKTCNEAGSGGRKYSGSKRSYDFDEERRRGGDEEEWEKSVLRASPHRRTPGRERSGSRERGSGGGRRVSRSPGRRSDGPAPSSGCESYKSAKQPAKMVSVPPREKNGSILEPGAKRVAGAAASAAANKRCASPRSRSPANTARASNDNGGYQSQPQPLSRSSSRKGEQSPRRRNPLAEIDDNSLRNRVHKSREGDEVMRKLIQSQPQKATEGVPQMRKPELRACGESSNGFESNNALTDCVRDQLMNCRAKKQEEAVGEKGVPKSIIEIPGALTRTRSSRRSSRDLDQNPISYNSLLLEDIHKYHQQNTAFSLPACISKACSILEAVADLNSSFSDNKSYNADESNNDNGSTNGRFARRCFASKEPFVESEIVVKDDLLEPSLHKYVSVRDIGGESEPQESAGSNSFIGQPWASSWEPNSVDSSDRCWTSQSKNSDEEVGEGELSPLECNQQPEKQQKSASEVLDKKSRGGSTSTGALNASRRRACDRRQPYHYSGGGNGKVGGRGLAHPAAAAAAASS